MLHTIYVMDDESSLAQAGLPAVSFNAYLKDYPKLGEPKTRVINLCDTSRYLSQGYYCSLLAEAREHKVVPSVKVINDLRSGGATLWAPNNLFGQSPLQEQETHTMVVCMGEVADARFRRLASWVFRKYTAPILMVVVTAEKGGARLQVTRQELAQLDQDAQTFCVTTLVAYAKKSWVTKAERKALRWDMALLINPEEAVPPSDKAAITRFVKAGEKLGIRVTPVTAQELNNLAQYDALFIRETTAIDHYTYRFANQAEQLGLVVIDDSTSILRCCNKVFLHDAFSYKKVPSLPSHIMVDASDETLTAMEEQLGYPMVLKMPEGSFSKGVFKVSAREEFAAKVTELLQDSALVLAQKYLFTEYDWRIGVINGRAFYACRYYMAKNHWQIYNHSKKRIFSGGFDALPTFEVPAKVLDAALKAASVIGNGFYGIDIKEADGKAYVLEVNDNPSIDHGVEDNYLGEELYMQVMAEFLRRLELRGR